MPEISDKELAELKKKEALADALQAKLKDAELKAGQVPELEARIKEMETARVESTFTGAGIADPKVRRLFNMEFEEQAAAEGGEKDLSTWLKSLTDSPDKAPGLLAPFLPKAQTGGNPAGQQGQQGPRQGNGKLPDSSKGAKTPDGAAPAYNPETINNMSDAEFRAAMPQLMSQFPGLAAFGGMPGFTSKNPNN